MVKLLYSVSMSLDGFIAGPGGDMSWLTPYLGPNPGIEGLMERIGALLVGRRTFEGDDPNHGTDKEGAFGGQWSGPQIVLTHDRHQPLDAGPATLERCRWRVSTPRARLPGGRRIPVGSEPTHGLDLRGTTQQGVTGFDSGR